MAERKLSKDGKQEAQVLGEEGAIGAGGRTGGRLACEIGSKDELKRAAERPAGITRVRKSHEKEG